MNEKKNHEGHRLRDLKFITATRMLDHFGLSMYSKYPKAISELVVNGYDADANYDDADDGGDDDGDDDDDGVPDAADDCYCDDVE